MEDPSRRIDVEKLMSYSDDLIQVLRDPKDINNLSQCSQHFKALHASCDSDLAALQNALQEYQKKIDACRGKTEVAIAEVIPDTEIDRLQKELEEELHKQRLLIEGLSSEIDELDHQRISLEDRKCVMKKLEQYDQREKMALSMYASVTNLIPNLDGESKVSGCIVNREKKVVHKFEFDNTKLTEYDICNNIWQMISRS